MSTVRFSQVTYATKSWVAVVWEKMVVEMFSGRILAEARQMDEVCESKWESELRKLQDEVHSLCHHAIHQLIPMAGAYQQTLLDDVSQAYTVYAPEMAESVSASGNQAIEDIKGHVAGIRYNASKMRQANRKVSELEDMHAKAVMYHHSVRPYMDTLHFHMDQLKRILHTA